MPREIYLDRLAVVKITILLIISLPFWCWPLFIGAIIKALDWQQRNVYQSAYTSITFWYGMIPFVFAYLSFLRNLIVIRKDKIARKLRIYSIKDIFAKHGQILLQLIVLSGVDVIINKFQIQSILINLSLIVFYFSTEVFEYFYRQIIKKAPFKTGL